MKKHVEVEKMVVDVTTDDSFYNDVVYEHRAKKAFSSIVEAVDSAVKNSYSIEGSDIYCLKVKDLAEAEEAINFYYRNTETSISPKMEVIGNVISYTTVSGANHISIEVLEDGNFEATYVVKSKRPLEKSSVMKNFKNNGWKCWCESAPYAIVRKAMGFDNSGYSYEIETKNLEELNSKLAENADFEIERFTYSENLYVEILEKLDIEGQIKPLEPIFDERSCCVGYYAPDFKKNNTVIAMVVYRVHEGDVSFRGWIRIEDEPYEIRWLEGLRFDKPIVENGEEEYEMFPIRESFHKNLSSSRY